MASLTKKNRKRNRVIKKFLEMGTEIPADLRPGYENIIKVWLSPQASKKTALNLQ